MMKFKHQEFADALPVLEIIEDQGYEAYFVGGCIRDVLLDSPINDIDIATSAYPAEVQEMFPKHFDVGLEHGTVMVWQDGKTYEVTTFRTESTYQDFRRPDKVEFVQSLSEDLNRRDFTMNALAMSSSGEILDYFGGKEDIASRYIRAVGEPQKRFGEDALRMMRAVRFASQLDFTIEAHTFHALSELSALLEKIAIERILVEMNKLWLGRNWHKGIQLMVDSGLFMHCPDLATSKALLEQLLVVLADHNHFKKANLAWAVLLHEALSNSSLDENLSVITISQFARDWKMSNADGNEIARIVKGLQFRRTHSTWSNWQLYELGIETCSLIESFIASEQALNSEYGSRFSPANKILLQNSWDELPIYSLKDLAINGRTIIKALAPSDKRMIGQALKLCEEQVVQNKIANEHDALLALIRTTYKL